MHFVVAEHVAGYDVHGLCVFFARRHFVQDKPRRFQAYRQFALLDLRLRKHDFGNFVHKSVAQYIHRNTAFIVHNFKVNVASCCFGQSLYESKGLVDVLCAPRIR